MHSRSKQKYHTDIYYLTWSTVWSRPW